MSDLAHTSDISCKMMTELIIRLSHKEVKKNNITKALLVNCWGKSLTAEILRQNYRRGIVNKHRFLFNFQAWVVMLVSLSIYGNDGLQRKKW